MQGKIAVVIALIVAVLAGCASARLALEKPVSGQCENTGLKECSVITDGVILYVEGDQRLAYQKLHVAAGSNEPDDVIAFAGGLKNVTREPGAAHHAAAIAEIADLLTREARDAARLLDAKEAERPAPKRKKLPSNTAKSSMEKRGEKDDGPLDNSGVRAVLEGTAGDAPPKGKISPVTGLAATSLPISQIEGRTVIPALDDGNRACVMSGIMSPSAESSRGYCVRVARGPLVITDLHSSSACPAELFALSVVPGDLSTPRWAVYGQASSAMNVSAGSLVVRENEQFVVGVMSSSDQKMKRDIRCSVTWSGWRPGATNSDAD
ncbi:MAG TPA: hypothetical protein VK550_07435 [Polyangiaceae bacterium]|nr:hypothetical protein [Polyangiaceae bacterium]